MAFLQGGLKGRNFTRGRELFVAVGCQACHRLGNDGGGIGPDLTGAANRYTLRDLVENIIEPSKVISDQYESTIFELNNGTVLVGRLSSEEGGILQVLTNPADPSQTTDIFKSELKSRQASPVSLMPPGLLNSMNKNEVLDLLAYTLSGGDRNNAMFKK